MRSKRSTQILSRLAGCCLAAAAAGVPPARAAVDGTLSTQDGRTFSGQLQWKKASKEYEVQQGGQSMRIPLDKVRSAKVKAPAELEAAAGMVKAGRYAAAIPALKQIADSYAMLEHDVTATRWLAEAYLKTADAKSAVAACEAVAESNPLATLLDDFAGVYAEALLADEQYGKLDAILTKIIQQGSRGAAAFAQVKRGDIEMKQGNYKDALLDGYLRTVVLFGDIKPTQPEALYKAAQCFDQLGQGPYAERMRKKLLADFPQDPYAQRVQSGK
jgi:tetratricopeptide (TPR) repeat protein